MNRRRLPRAKKRMSCGMTADGRRYSAVVLDISPNGVFLQTSAKLDVGAIVDLELNLPGEDHPVLAQARVARLKLVPHELRSVERGGIGLQIDLPPPEFLMYYAEATRAEIPDAAPPKHDVPKPGAARRRAVKASAEPTLPPVEKKKTEIEYRVRLSQIGGNRTRNLVILCDTVGQAEAAALAETGDGWKVLVVESGRGPSKK